LAKVTRLHGGRPVVIACDLDMLGVFYEHLASAPGIYIPLRIAPEIGPG